MLIVRKLLEGYNQIFNLKNDPEKSKMFLMGSPIPFFLLLAAYCWFVTTGGRKFMANRKPFELTRIMMIYNFSQVVLNLVLTCYVLYWTYWQDYYSFKCQPIYNGTDPDRRRHEFLVTYGYLVMKIYDWLDTIFMVLRRKQTHISFLHLYHHIGIAIGTFFAAKFFPGGHGTLLGLINSFVHSVMYFYYFLTTFKPELKKSIWWKKHITQLQMIQFTYLICHFAYPLIFVPDCGYPKPFLWFLLMQALFMNLMFSDFYYKAYIKTLKKV